MPDRAGARRAAPCPLFDQSSQETGFPLMGVHVLFLE